MSGRRSLSSPSPTCAQIIGRCDHYFKEHKLSSFTLTIPLITPTAKANQDGITEKIMKNTSNLVTHYNTAESIKSAGEVPIEDEVAVKSIRELTNWLVPPSAGDGNEKARQPFSGSLTYWHRNCRRGVVLLVAEPLGNEDDAMYEGRPRWRPIGGGVISWRETDLLERQVNALWCRRDLPKHLLTTNFIHFLTIRVLAAALSWPADKDEKTEGRALVSILDVYMKHFPRAAVQFLKSVDDGLGFGPHYELPENVGRHVANPKSKCPCASWEPHARSYMYWGTTELRFRDCCRQRLLRTENGWSLQPTTGRERRSLQPNYGYRYQESDSPIDNGETSPHPTKRRRDMKAA